MKKSRSLHLEEDIWTEIDNYKDKYKLSSRNAAVERMFVERRMLLMMHDKSFNNEDVSDVKNDNPPSKEVEDSRISYKLKNTIDNSFDNMPD